MAGQSTSFSGTPPYLHVGHTLDVQRGKIREERTDEMLNGRSKATAAAVQCSIPQHQVDSTTAERQAQKSCSVGTPSSAYHASATLVSSRSAETNWERLDQGELYSISYANPPPQVAIVARSRSSLYRAQQRNGTDFRGQCTIMSATCMSHTFVDPCSALATCA